MARWAIVWTGKHDDCDDGDFCTLCRADTAEAAVLAAETFYEDQPGTYRAVRIPDDQPAITADEIDDYLGSESYRLDGTPGYEWPDDGESGVLFADRVLETMRASGKIPGYRLRPEDFKAMSDEALVEYYIRRSADLRVVGISRLDGEEMLAYEAEIARRGLEVPEDRVEAAAREAGEAMQEALYGR